MSLGRRPSYCEPERSLYLGLPRCFLAQQRWQELKSMHTPSQSLKLRSLCPAFLLPMRAPCSQCVNKRQKIILALHSRPCWSPASLPSDLGSYEAVWYFSMAKGWCSSRSGSKLTMVFFSTSISCLLLLILLHHTAYDNYVIPCSNCRQLGPLVRDPETVTTPNCDRIVSHLLTEVIANLSSHPSQNADSHNSPGKQAEAKVIHEWELPATTNDRPHEKLDDPEIYGEARRLKPLGIGSFLFIQFGAYRGGSNTFAVVGLATKGLHQHGNPGFECSWVSNGDSSTTVQGNATKYYPDFHFNKQYRVVVVNCTFESEVGVDGSGGRLEFVANHGSADQTGLPDVQFVALTEKPNKYDGSIFEPPYKYDYLYCGSPLYGSISPQRMREWTAYHVRLFGPRSHFILYDAGGIHDDVRKILQPWIKLGFISLINFRQEARYDVYYYSQFLVNNDCLFQAKTLANWTFFFDVDEYIYFQDDLHFHQVMLDHYDKGRRSQQLTIRQKIMNDNHCRNESLGSEERKWGFEKLVYRCTEDTNEIKGFSNRKYAIQPQYALAAGVHGTDHVLLPEGTQDYRQTVVYNDLRLYYYHYHNTISRHSEVCEKFVDAALNETRILNATHVVDTSMSVLADAVKEFEKQTVGPQPYLL